MTDDSNHTPGSTRRTQHSQNGEGVERARARRDAKDASGAMYVDGSIYEGMEACLVRSGKTVAHVVKYADAVEIAEAVQSLAREPATADVGRDDYDTFVELEGWVREYRQSMNADVLHLWARDMVETGKKLLAIRDRVLDAALSRAAPSSEPCGYCGVDPCRCDATDLCEAPGCDNKTDRGICDACDQWVSDQVAAPSSEPAIAEGSVPASEFVAFANCMLAQIDAAGGDMVTALSIAAKAGIDSRATTPPTTNDAIPAGEWRCKGCGWLGSDAIGMDHPQNGCDRELMRFHPGLSAAPSAPATEAGEDA